MLPTNNLSSKLFINDEILLVHTIVFFKASFFF